MGATAVLAEQVLTVEPGGETRCQVKVRNNGTVVDQYTLEVLGDADAWAAVEPNVLSLFPGDEGAVQLLFSPPRHASTIAGPVPFAVRAVSKEDPGGSVVEEGTIEVRTFLDTFAELLPRTSRGRRSARYELAVDNRGNARINARLSAVDPDELLSFALSPPAVVVEPGTAAFAKIVVRPRKRFWRGPARTIPFQVSAETGGGQPLVADGAMLHEALLPRWLPRVLLALAGLALLLGIAWLTLFRPTIESAARDKAAEVAAAVAEEAGADAGAAAARQELAETSPTPNGGGAGAGEGGGGAGAGSPGEGGSGGGTGPVSGPVIDGRLVVGGASTFVVPEGKTLQLTDIVLQNPDGNTGTLRIERSGTPLLVVALQNFRDLDYHFIAPPLFSAGQQLQLTADCPDGCAPGAYWAGFLVDAP